MGCSSSSVAQIVHPMAGMLLGDDNAVDVPFGMDRPKVARVYYKAIIPPVKVSTPIMTTMSNRNMKTAHVFPRHDDNTALQYTQAGGGLIGRLPHPSVALRAADEGERIAMEHFRKLNLFSPSPDTLKRGHFPTTQSTAIIGPPLGPPLAGVSAQMHQHCRQDWWRTPTTCRSCRASPHTTSVGTKYESSAPVVTVGGESVSVDNLEAQVAADVASSSKAVSAEDQGLVPDSTGPSGDDADSCLNGGSRFGQRCYDDEAEAALQEAYLRVCFPGLFFGGSEGSRAYVYKDGFCFTGTGWTLGLAEGHTAGRSEMMHSSAWDHQHSGNISDALVRALDEHSIICGRLREAGLEERLWFTGLDEEKLALTRRAAAIYRGDEGRYNGPGYGDLQLKLRQLRVGDILWRSHGWAEPTSGHCVIHLYEKTGPNTMAIVCCNSGDGLENHPHIRSINSPGTIGNYPTCKAVTAMRVDHIDMNSERFMDLGNWYWLDRCQEFRDRLHGSMSYNFGLPYLVGKSLRRAVRDSPDLQGWPSTGQRGDTCGYRGPVKAFQYLLRRYGFSKADIKEVTFAQRLFFVVWAGEQLAALRHDAGQNDVPLARAAVVNAGYEGSQWTGAGMETPPVAMRRAIGRSDYLVLDMGCASLALTSLKLHDRGRLTDGGLRVALGVVRRVRQLMPHPSLYWFAIPRPLPAPSLQCHYDDNGKRGRHVPMELLLDWMPVNLHGKAGAVENGDFPPALDLVGIADAIIAAKSLRDLVSVLINLVGACRSIRIRFEVSGEMANSKLHVVGLLHSAFASGELGCFSIPLPCESRGIRNNSTSVWTSGVITAELQEQLLSSLIDLSCELASASRSLPYCGETDAVSLIAQGAMVAIMDAVLMQNATVTDTDCVGGACGSARQEVAFLEYYQALSLCSKAASGMSFADRTSTAPVSSYGTLRVRADVQAYFDAASFRSEQGTFLLWQHEEDAERQTCFRIPVNLKPLDCTCDVFRLTAIKLGYHPATTIDQFVQVNPARATVGGKASLPLPDFPDEIVRRMGIFSEFKTAKTEFSGVPDKHCGNIHDHEVACGWTFGSPVDNKLLAHPQGKSLADCRDILLLFRILLEPANLNATRPLISIKPGKLCVWSPMHARPVLCGTKSDLDNSGVYKARLVSVQAFNRAWVLGRAGVVPECAVAHPLISGFKWDSQANKREAKSEEDVLHAPSIPTFGGALSNEDAEALLSFLTVPAVRVGLVLHFFADTSRLTCLFNGDLRRLVWAAVFCPGEWPIASRFHPSSGEALPPPALVAAPCAEDTRLRVRLGVLAYELRASPKLVLGSCCAMLRSAVEVAKIGDFTTPYSVTVFFVVRLVAGVLESAQNVLRRKSVDAKHWECDGFAKAPSAESLSDLSAGCSKLAGVLRWQVMPLLRLWTDEALAVTDGTPAGGSATVNASENRSPEAAKTRIAAELAMQEVGQRMSISASAHMALLAGPALCASDLTREGEYSVDESGAGALKSYLSAAFYTNEWHGKGMASLLYGSSATPPSCPPRWNGAASRAVFAGTHSIWPVFDIHSSNEPKYRVEVTDRQLGFPAQLLWNAMATRRRAVAKWFRDADFVACERVLCAVLKLSIGDPLALWQGTSTGTLQTLGSCFSADGRLRMDLPFAELCFKNGREGSIPMPDMVGADPDLQMYLLAERKGTESAILPRVIARERRPYRKWYYLPSSRSGDKGLELKLWKGVPLCPEDDETHIEVTGFGSVSSREGVETSRRAMGAVDTVENSLNGFYYSTSRRSGNQPVYEKLMSNGGGSLILRRTNSGGAISCGFGDRWHIESPDKSCLAWFVGEIENTPAVTGPNATSWVAKDVSHPSGFARLVASVITVTFNQHVEAPSKLSWNGVFAVHDGVMGKRDWISFVVHHGGGLHSLTLSYASLDSRPVDVKVDGKVVLTGVVDKKTGGYGTNNIQSFDEGELDLGSPGTSRIQFRAKSFMPHIQLFKLAPLNIRRVDGFPSPQNFTGYDSTRRESPCSFSVLRGRSFDSDVVQFRGMPFGGSLRCFQLANCRAPSLFGLLSSSVRNAEDRLPGGRYAASSASCAEPRTQTQTSSRHWRIVARNGTLSGDSWVVRSLKFLDREGREIVHANKGTAFCSGSVTPALGPETALGCKAETGEASLDRASTAGEGRYWVSRSSGERPMNDDRADSSAMFIGIHFTTPEVVSGIEIVQQDISEVDNEVGDASKHIALVVDLEMFNDSCRLWEPKAVFTLLGALSGECVRAQVHDSSGESCALRALIESELENWLGEFLYRVISPSLSRSIFNDDVVVLLPAKEVSAEQQSVTVLLCDPKKPSLNRWSFLVVNKAHRVADLFGLREHGRRCFSSLVWTSDWNSCRREVLPPPGIQRCSKFLPHPFVERMAGDFFDSDPSNGGWAPSCSQSPSLVVERTVGGILQQLIPDRYLHGVVPDVLIQAFRFWRDEEYSSLVAERNNDGNDDDSFFSYDLSIEFSTSSQPAVFRDPDTSLGGINISIRSMQAKIWILRNSIFGQSISREKEITDMKVELEELKRQRLNAVGDGRNSSKSGLVKTNVDSTTDEALLCDVFRSAPDLQDPGRVVRHKLVDLMSPVFEEETWPHSVMTLLRRVENLSHVLVWALVDNCKTEDRLSLLQRQISHIDLPRLRLKFTTGLDSQGKVRVFSAEHTGMFLMGDCDNNGSEMRSRFDQLCSVTPYSLLLGDEEGNAFLLVPNCPHDPQPQFLVQPWATTLYPCRDDQQWLDTFESRVYLYKVHESRLWLEMPSLEAALLWAYLLVCDKRFSDAAQVVDAMSSDEQFSPQELFQLKQFENITSTIESNSSAALKAKLWLRFRDSPVVKHWPWGSVASVQSSVETPVNDPSALAPLLARHVYHHTPAAVRLSHADEKLLISRNPANSKSFRPEYIKSVEDGDLTLKMPGDYYCPPPDNVESFRQFACGRGRSCCAHRILELALEAVERAKKDTDPYGWTRIQGYFLSGMKRGDQFSYETLEAAKHAFMAAEQDDRPPRGIVLYREKYYLCSSICCSEGAGTSWVYCKSIRDRRGTRAKLWNAKSVRLMTPHVAKDKTKLIGPDVIGKKGVLNTLIHDGLDGGLNSMGFLYACQLFEGKLTLSIDGEQDNTCSLLGGAIHVMYSDSGVYGGLGLDNSLPMAILAVLATHKIGSIPNFPLVSKWVGGLSELEQNNLAHGGAAGSLPLLPDRYREETNPAGHGYSLHMGEFLAQAADACFQFLNSPNEAKHRCGVGLFDSEPLLSSDCPIPLDPSVVSTRVVSDGLNVNLFATSLDNRLQRKRPKPSDFGCSSVTLKPSAATVSSSELVSLASYPLVELINSVQGGEFISPPLPRDCSPEAVMDSLDAAFRRKEYVEEQAAIMKGDDAFRPRLQLPLNDRAPGVASPVGASMIRRIECSMVDYGVRVEEENDSCRVLKADGIAETDVVNLFVGAKAMLSSTVALVAEQAKYLEVAANRCTVTADASQWGYSETAGFLRYLTAKCAWLEPHVELSLVLGSVLATNGVEQLQDANPLLDKDAAGCILDSAALMMLRCGTSSKRLCMSTRA